MKFGVLARSTALASSLLLFAGSATAQQATDTAAAPAAGASQGTQTDEVRTNADGEPAAADVIVVTGSRIARPNDVSAAPITTISAAELTQTARTSIGDVLNDLPQLQSTFSQSNSTRFLGTAGLNLLDLRGLGTQRTLVLVNGRRHVGSDVLNNAVSVDINTIPTDLIEGVDILTGGVSAVYGSDALAGVVNFRLRTNYDGVQLRAQGSVSDEGDAGSYFISATAGKNFAEGRGNIAVNLEYTRTEDLFAADRREYRQNDAFVTTNIDAAGPGLNGNINFDGISDSTFLRDIRVASFSDGGLVSIAGAGMGANTPATCGRDVLGRAYTCTYLFQPGGALARQTGTRAGIAGGTAAMPVAAPAGVILGGNGNTRREGTLLQLLPQIDRYAANLIGHFDVSEAFVPYIEAKYVRTESVGLGGSGPAFYTGSTIDGRYERPELNNPYLNADARATLSAQLLQSVNNGINPNGSATALTAAQQETLRAQIAAGTYRFILRKNLTDLGSRREDALRETYRIVGGVRGTFNDTWNYDVSVNYGEFSERTKVLGNVDVQRLSYALDAQRNAAGQIVCGSQIDASRAAADLNGNAANQAADIAACRPLNPFGVGSASPEAINYILRNTESFGKITQFDVLASLSGDTSKFLTLPGGAIQFSLGGEYRRETNFFQADPLVEQGYTFYNALAKFDPPAFEVKEAFGELSIPLLKDVFLINDLTLGAAGRVSDYNSSAGTVYAYNFSVEYSPFADLRLRGNYGRAVRAPNLTELYSTPGQNFAPGFVDPCSADNLGRGTQFRAANCQAAGIPNSYNYQYVQSLEITSGGNAALNVETSDSWTYGGVYRPSFVPGLSLSVDYYNIAVDQVISALAAQSIVNNCYDSPSIENNQFCSQFERVAAGGTGPAGEQPYRIVEGSLLQSSFNFAQLKVRGIDANLSYTRRLGDVRLSGQVIYTHLFEASSFTNPLQPAFADTRLGELGTPKDQVNVNLGADFGSVTFDTQFRYLAKQSVGAIENRIAFQGRVPQNLDDFSVPFYPDVLYIGAKLGFDVDDRSNFYIGVDNLTDRLPPLGATGTGAGSAIFDNVGRRFYAGVTARF